MAIALRYAARSDVGLVRSNNQDSGYAGPHLLVVADGMGGHAGGDIASSLAVGELAPLDDESHGADDALEHLSDAIAAAHGQLLTRVDEEPALAGMGTTVTALLRSGNRLALAHIGDSRAYLLRDGALVQLTKDHTFVQTLVDQGRITLAEAEHHPQRSVVMRVLSVDIEDAGPDLSMREARIGDRYLLCSDGLSGVVSVDTLQDTLAAQDDPGTTCEKLVELALRAGAPDNVTCIVADVVDDVTAGDSAPFVVGSAALHQPRRGLPGARGSAAERAAALTAAGDDDEEGSPEPLPNRSTWRVPAAATLVLLLVLGGGFGLWRWVQSQMFVGADQDVVAVFTGLPQDIGPISLSNVRQRAEDVPLADLPDYAKDRVREGIPAADDTDAEEIVTRYRELAQRCRASATVAASPTPSPTGSPSPAATASGAVGASPAPVITASSAAAVTVTPQAAASDNGSSVRAGASAMAAVTPSPTSTPSAPAPTTTPSPAPTGVAPLDCAGTLP